MGWKDSEVFITCSLGSGVEGNVMDLSIFAPTDCLGHSTGSYGSQSSIGVNSRESHGFLCIIKTGVEKAEEGGEGEGIGNRSISSITAGPGRGFLGLVL